MDYFSFSPQNVAAFFGAFDPNAFLAITGSVWSSITVAAFIFSVFAIGLLVYVTMRIMQARHALEHKLHTISFQEADREVDHSRWDYAMSLIEGVNESDWRHAIIQADLMLDEVMDQEGHRGVDLDAKLAAAPDFETKQEALEAHEIRKQLSLDIHFVLDDHTAYRTMKKYEAVLKAFGEIE